MWTSISSFFIIWYTIETVSDENDEEDKDRRIDAAVETIREWGMGKAWREGESMEDMLSGFVRDGRHEFSTGMPSLFVIVLSPISEPRDVQHSNLIQLNRATLSSGPLTRD